MSLRPAPAATPAPSQALAIESMPVRSEAEEMIRSTLEAAPRITDAEALLAEIYRQRAAHE